MTFAGARIPEHEQILLAIQKASIREGLQLPSGLDGQAFQVEVNHRLFLRQCRLAQQGCDAVSPPGLALSLRQLQQVLAASLLNEKLAAECLAKSEEASPRYYFPAAVKVTKPLEPSV